jgi:hypothetical protein
LRKSLPFLFFSFSRTLCWVKDCGFDNPRAPHALLAQGREEGGHRAAGRAILGFSFQGMFGGDGLGFYGWVGISLLGTYVLADAALFRAAD